jgi:hypothetical protein
MVKKTFIQQTLHNQQKPTAQKKLAFLLSDPGIVIAIGNICLFSQDGGPSFMFVTVIGLLIILTKCIGAWESSFNRYPFFANQERLKRFAKKGYAGLEIAGYGCFGLAILAVLSHSIYGFICGISFGFANLILTNRFERENQKMSLATAFERGSELRRDLERKPSQTFSVKLFLGIFKEPIFLIAIGMTCSGLFAGGESLLALPCIIAAPAIAIFKPTFNRALPQFLLAVASTWYTCVAITYGHTLALISNALYTIAYLLIAWREHQLHTQRKG